MSRKGFFIKENAIFGLLLILIFVFYSIFALTSSAIFYIFQKNLVKILFGLSVILLVYKKANFREIKLERVFFGGCILFLFIFLLSKFFEFQSGIINTKIIDGIFTMAFPLIIVLGVLNSLDSNEIYFCMVAILLVTFGAYFLEMYLSGNMNVSAIKSISIKDSYSPFESHYFSGLSVGLAAYFSYFNKDKKWTILSFIFCFFTFKRIIILFAIILLFLPIVKTDLRVKSGNTIAFIMTAIFSLLGIGYTYMLMPQNISVLDSLTIHYFGLSITKLVMARDHLLGNLIYSGFVRAGIDSTFLFSKDIEMDLVRLFLELGVAGVFAIVLYFWMLAKDNYFSYMFMLSIMMNLLFSHSIHSTLGWILKYIVILGILLDNNSEKINEKGMTYCEN